MKRNKPGKKTYSARAGRSAWRNHRDRLDRPWTLIVQDPTGRDVSTLDPSALDLRRAVMEGTHRVSAWRVGDTGRRAYVMRGGLSQDAQWAREQLREAVPSRGDTWHVFTADTHCVMGTACSNTGSFWVSETLLIPSHVPGWCIRVLRQPLGWKAQRSLKI